MGSTFVPVVNRMALALAKALDLPEAGLVSVALSVEPSGVHSVTASYFLDDAAAARAVSAIAAIDPEISR